MIILEHLIFSINSVHGVDKTLEENAIGTNVTDAVVNKIQESNIFKNDRMFLRRIAQAESKDGLECENIKNVFTGGIWQVQALIFNTTAIL